MSAYVFMVPGFLGFVDLGRFEYFRRVGEQLQASRSLGPTATIVRVEIHPSASLRERATQLATAIAEHAGNDDWPIHVVAHSTGGLDARLMLTPGASLPVAFDLETLARRVRSLVTVATPHHGTPLASFFDGLAAQRLLRLGSQGAANALRAAQVPRKVAGRMAGMLARLTGSRPSELALPPAGGQLLDALPEDERKPLRRMLERMGEDQALVPQLSPEGIELFNASTNDRPTVRYGCVVACAPRPGLTRILKAGVHPGHQTSSALYSVLHQIAGRTPATRSRAFDPTRCQEISAAFDCPVDWNDSDGVVPTLSQVWGEVVHVTLADHLDVVGHFGDDQRPPEHRDVLVSGSSFGREQFTALWGDVAEFLRAAEPQPLRGTPFGAIRSMAAVRSAAAVGSAAAVHSAAAVRSAAAAAVRSAVAPTIGPAPLAAPPPPPARWRAAVRVAGVLASFSAYEGWQQLVGDIALARFLGFAVCLGALGYLFARTRNQPVAPGPHATD